jgi:sugar phosphate isomerase/epimerase
MANTRRDFLKQGAIGATLLGLGSASFLTSCMKEGIDEPGLIFGVIRKELEQDWEGTLRKVAKFGYKHIEFGGFYGPDKETFKKLLREIGLKPLAGGTSISEMKKDDNLKKLIDESLDYGKKYLVCYWPWMDGGDNKKLDDFKNVAAELNTLGETCKKRGIRFLFHNHNKEFVEVDGYRWGYEVILENTDPKLVGMELDLYWITKGGGDPLYLFSKYPHRFEIFHVKDMDNTSEKLYTCPGYGIIDFASIFAKSGQAGVKYYIVEIDENPDPMKCIEDSCKYLKELRF